MHWSQWSDSGRECVWQPVDLTCATFWPSAAAVWHHPRCRCQGLLLLCAPCHSECWQRKQSGVSITPTNQCILSYRCNQPKGLAASLQTDGCCGKHEVPVLAVTHPRACHRATETGDTSPNMICNNDNGLMPDKNTITRCGST